MPVVLDATDPRTRADAVRRAARLLRAGELVAFPTETVYGLGARARDEAAVRRVFAAKGRPADHPLIVHLHDRAAVDAWAEGVPEAADALARAFWPGPLTLVLRARADVPPAVTGGRPTVALRMPGHAIAAALLEVLGEELAAPSANRFGRVSPTTAAHVLREFGAAPGPDAAPRRVAAVLDGGPCDVGLESTIVDLSGDAPRVLRPGAIGAAALAEVLGAPVPSGPDAASPRAPGTLGRHYAPAVPARTVDARTLAAAPAAAAAIVPVGTPTGAARRFELPGDPVGYGRALYAAIREAEASGADEILFGAVPDDEAWAAVADRLRRATRAAGEGTP